MAYSISSIKAREVLDSRGNPTIEAQLILMSGAKGHAMVPSGASKGEHEAIELRDGDPKRFFGKGVLRAIGCIENQIAPLLSNRAFSTIQELDRLMCEADATPQKQKLGANSILAVSLAFAHAVSEQEKRPLYQILNDWIGLSEQELSLPVPFMNILNGGLHANNGLEFQEFMIVPHGFESFKEALRAGCEVFQTLKEKLHSLHLSTAVGDEGGFAPSLENNDRALSLISESVKSAGYQLGKQISLALDVAASSFYTKKENKYEIKSGLAGNELIDFYISLKNKFPIISIEDGLDENDWEGWKRLNQKMGATTQLVGDDLFVTQVKRLNQGIEMGAANSVLIKVNQVGTLSETFDTMNLAKKHHFKNMVSHRSGETEDTTIAHLAVGSGCGQIKCGSLSRGERTAKYNELLRIEENSQIPFAGF